MTTRPDEMTIRDAFDLDSYVTLSDYGGFKRGYFAGFHARLEAYETTVRKALALGFEHEPGCNAINSQSHPECTCGWTETEASLRSLAELGTQA